MKEARHTRSHIIRSHLHETSRTGRLVVARRCEGHDCLMRSGFPLEVIESSAMQTMVMVEQHDECFKWLQYYILCYVCFTTHTHTHKVTQ